MKSRWNEREARILVRSLGRQGVSRDLALRVYTARLLGSERRLVLHGGGNVSVKIKGLGSPGSPGETLCVKGSGWDMASIEPAGLPALRLAPLRELRRRKRLGDAEMTAALRVNLLDPASPDPSVETLLHAFLPHAFVDHTHANASLAVMDQPNPVALARETWGDRVAIVPYVMPGFNLAKACAEAYERNPFVEGLVLLRHGLFSFGATARESYERMIRLVTMAEERVDRSGPVPRLPTRTQGNHASVFRIAPMLRGLVSRAASEGGGPRRLALEFRSGKAALWLAGLDAPRRLGPATPDHVLRTKHRFLVLPFPENDDFVRKAERSVAVYVARCRTYFERHRHRAAASLMPLDPAPRVLLVPGVGLFAAGQNVAAARQAADLAEVTAEVARDAERVGSYRCLSDANLFDVEYWPLERAKLAKMAPRAFAGYVVAVTGGAGAIGRATGEAFAAEGADVVLIDHDKKKLAAAATETGAFPVEANLLDSRSVAHAFGRIVHDHGGLDVLVSNAGTLQVGRIGEVSEADLRKSFEINFFAHQRVAQAALKIFRTQGLGGVLLFNVSKQALAPGPGIGAYGTAKAATLSLMRQYALEYGREGIRAGAVNPDRIRSGLLSDEVIQDRAIVREISEEEYMAGNLLGREVRAIDVGRAFVALALQDRTTAAVLTVDGGNLAASVR